MIVTGKRMDTIWSRVGATRDDHTAADVAFARRESDGIGHVLVGLTIHVVKTRFPLVHVEEDRASFCLCPTQAQLEFEVLSIS